MNCVQGPMEAKQNRWEVRGFLSGLTGPVMGIMPHKFSPFPPMPVDSHGEPSHPAGVGETPTSSSSATFASATMLDRLRAKYITARLRLPGFFRVRVKIGAGIMRDIRARAPWYWSDWKDAWNYRVIPATALVFFAKYVLSEYLAACATPFWDLSVDLLSVYYPASHSPCT